MADLTKSEALELLALAADEVESALSALDAGRISKGKRILSDLLDELAGEEEDETGEDEGGID